MPPPPWMAWAERWFSPGSRSPETVTAAAATGPAARAVSEMTRDAMRETRDARCEK